MFGSSQRCGQLVPTADPIGSLSVSVLTWHQALWPVNAALPGRRISVKNTSPRKLSSDLQVEEDQGKGKRRGQTVYTSNVGYTATGFIRNSILTFSAAF